MKMHPANILYVLAFAACTLQCNAAEIPVSADKIDLRLFVVNGAAVARTMYKALNAGLDQSKPNVENMLNELAPEAKVMIRKVIDDARAKLNEEDKRIQQIFAILTKALDDLKPIKPCSDKVSPTAKKLAIATEKEVVNIVQKAQEKYKKEIQNIKIGAEKTLKKARTLFDTEVAAVVKCLTPGRKDANTCLNTEIDKILKGVNEVVSEVFVLVNTASESLSPMVDEVMEKMIPLLKKVFVEGRVILKTLADCVAALK